MYTGSELQHMVSLLLSIPELCLLPYFKITVAVITSCLQELSLMFTN